jgi:small subunit ribosomal protein S11
MQGLKELFFYKRVLKQSRYDFKNFISKSSFLRPNNFKPLRNYPFCNLYLKSSFCNTFITITSSEGNVILSKSCGNLGFEGKKKRTTKFAVESTLDSVVSNLSELGYSRVFLILDGFAKARFFVLGTLKKYKVSILGIRDITPKSHNGCRLKKLRRG